MYTKQNINYLSKNLQNSTFFINVPTKSDISDIYKNLNSEILDIPDISEFKIIQKSVLRKISHKNIGKYIKSSNNKICDCCNKDILLNNIYKKLECSHRFHVKCIDSKLKNDLFKKCIVCDLEHVSKFL
jgi:hypothetical protein